MHVEKRNVVPLYSEESQAAAGLKSIAADVLRYLRWHLAGSDEADRPCAKPTESRRHPDHPRATGRRNILVGASDDEDDIRAEDFGGY